MRRASSTRRAIATVVAAGLAAAWHGTAASSADRPAASCNEFLLAKDELPGVSLQSCRAIETDVTSLGAPYRRVDMGITGTIDGMTAKDGPRTNYFTQSPEFVFAQTNTSVSCSRKASPSPRRGGRPTRTTAT